VVVELDEKVIEGMRVLFTEGDFKRLMEFYDKVKDGLCERSSILFLEDHYEKMPRVKIH